MTSRRDRVFAWVGVIIAAMSAVALSVAVIVQQVITDRNNKIQTDSQNAIAACKDSQSEAVLPVPDVYKPGAAVAKLMTTDIIPGSGASVRANDCLVVKYYGTLAANGVKFDENFTAPSGFAFIIGKGNVIQGWDRGLIGMKVGGTRRLVIPAQMAYGSQSSGAIPANADLVFVVKLLRIQK